jgi:hypothetical protein
METYKTLVQVELEVVEFWANSRAHVLFTCICAAFRAAGIKTTSELQGIIVVGGNSLDRLYSTVAFVGHPQPRNAVAMLAVWRICPETMPCPHEAQTSLPTPSIQ